MDPQRQSAAQKLANQPTEAKARHPVSRCSSMQVETGNEESIDRENPRTDGKGSSDTAYSIERWLNQKPGDEPWHGSRR
jgi:hypothetical protein